VTVHQQDGLGLTPIKLDVTGGKVVRVAMTQGKGKLGRRFAKVDGLAKALGVKPREIKGTGLVPQVCSTGAASLQVPLASTDIVRELNPDLRALGKIAKSVSHDPGVYVFAFLDATEGDIHARGFFPLQGIPEPACLHPATDATPFVSFRYSVVNTSMMTKRMTESVAAYPKSRSE